MDSAVRRGRRDRRLRALLGRGRGGHGPGKPEPDVYRHAADELGVDPAECVAVEDSTHGVASATAAGMTRIGYRGVDAKERDLAAADSAVDGPQELRAALLAR